jgi:hypothetical protein
VRQQREGHREGPRAARLLRTQQNMLLCSTRGPHWKSTANGGGSGWRRQAVREISRPLLRNIEPSKANQTRKAAGGRASVFLEHGAKNQGRLQAPGAVGAGTALPSWCCRPCTVRAVVSVCRPKPKSLTWACAAPRWRRPAGRGAGPRFKNACRVWRRLAFYPGTGSKLPAVGRTAKFPRAAELLAARGW